MKNQRIIKRYNNRRLYDTTESKYITLEDIKKLVLNNLSFQIIDNETKEDFTNYVLLQIINEEENQNFPIFTTEFLKNIIRLYGNPFQNKISQFLEHNFLFLINNKNLFEEYCKESSINTFQALNHIIQQNFESWTTFLAKTNKKKD